jgi:hypothetical protein
MQRHILKAMLTVDCAMFTGRNSRRIGFRIAEVRAYSLSPGCKKGIIIYAYGQPQWFLKSRGMIEQMGDEGEESYWYRLTAAGRAASERIK